MRASQNKKIKAAATGTRPGTKQTPPAVVSTPATSYSTSRHRQLRWKPSVAVNTPSTSRPNRQGNSVRDQSRHRHQQNRLTLLHHSLPVAKPFVEKPRQPSTSSLHFGQFWVIKGKNKKVAETVKSSTRFSLQGTNGRKHTQD